MLLTYFNSRDSQFKVKGMSMSVFTEEDVAFIASMGNEASNAIFLARIGDYPIPNGNDTNKMKDFIRLKYVDKKWVAGGGNRNSGGFDRDNNSFGNSSSSNNNFGGNNDFDSNDAFGDNNNYGNNNNNRRQSMGASKTLTKTPVSFPLILLCADLICSSPVDHHPACQCEQTSLHWHLCQAC